MELSLRIEVCVRDDAFCFCKSECVERFEAVVMRVGGAFPQLYLNGLPEEVED